MATKTIVLRGLAEWAKIFPDNYDKGYKDGPPKASMNLYLIDEDLPLFIAQKLKNKIRKTEDGKTYVTLGRLKKPWEKELTFPKVTNADGTPFTSKIGNGSKVEVTLSVYDGKFGPASSIEAVKVVELVVYTPKPPEYGGGAPAAVPAGKAMPW